MLTKTQNLEQYVPILRNYFDSVKSEWLVDKEGRHFTGISVWCPSLFRELYIEKIKSLIPDGARIFYLPNSEEIIIE